MPSRTRKPDGTWVNDPIPQARPARASAPAQGNEALLAQIDKLNRQKASMASTLASVSQCKNISQVRKALEHGRQTFPTK